MNLGRVSVFPRLAQSGKIRGKIQSLSRYSQIFLVLVYVREAEHVRMIDQFHNRDLPFHLHQHRL